MPIAELEQPSHIAFKTWEAEGESLASVEARIHDGAPIERLKERAFGYLDRFHTLFPKLGVPSRPAVLEIGSGVGYVMEAAIDRYKPARIVGLDVAAGMIEKAQERLRRDGVDNTNVDFVHYDGIDAPLPDNSFDLIYSVACLQHAPRAFCYRALLEAHRMIRPGGIVMVHLLAYTHFREHMTPALFRAEVDQQIGLREGHWHHYYAIDEIDAVLRHGIDVRDPQVREHAGSLYLTFGKK